MLLNYLLFISNDLFFFFFFQVYTFNTAIPCVLPAADDLDSQVQLGRVCEVGRQNYCREFGKRSLMIMLQTSKNEYSKVHSQASIKHPQKERHRLSPPLPHTHLLSTSSSLCLWNIGPLREIYYGPSGFLKSFRHHHQQLPNGARLPTLN